MSRVTGHGPQGLGAEGMAAPSSTFIGLSQTMCAAQTPGHSHLAEPARSISEPITFAARRGAGRWVLIYPTTRAARAA